MLSINFASHLIRLRNFCCSIISVAVIIIIFSGSAHAVQHRFTYVGDFIPKFIPTGISILYSGSDSLFLNGDLLQTGRDYYFNKFAGGFDLTGLAVDANDTLVVSYSTAPNWLLPSFGQPVPQLSQSISQSSASLPPQIPTRLQKTELSDIKISGAKTFRFTTQTSGTSDFGQSLDLNIEGNLESNLKISGSISDRGYNPSYGTSNSRLEELDKVNLRLESKSLLAQVGDMQLGRRLFQQNPVEKKTSGVSVNVNSSNFNFNGVAARPKGRFNTFKFNGIDGVQGPYQVGEDSRAGAIVPNSEKAWLDGVPLVRGTDNDYTMDYPAGRITFTVKHLIDRRSRIEIDYEPASTAYETELFSTGGGYSTGDSTFYAAVEWYSEGDVSGQPQSGELSQSDKLLLQSSGDNTALAFRSGARADSSGNYIINPDSLPNTVYQYVGDSNGTHNVVFSFVGTQKGSYKFVGGEEYVFVGNYNGDYDPIVQLPLPQRTDFYTTKFGLNNSVLGSMQTEFSSSQFDRNLLSSLDDNDNQGLLLNLDSRKQFRIYGRDSNLQLRLRMKEATYDARCRIDVADFRRNYLTPLLFNPQADERLYEGKSEVFPIGSLRICPSYGHLDYKNRFTSDRFEIGTTVGAVAGLNGTLLLSSTSAELTDSVSRQGNATSWRGAGSVPIVEGILFISEFEHDHRINDYTGAATGLSYNRYFAKVERASEKITYEYYIEDSLYTTSADHLKRNRISGSSTRKLANLNYTTYLGYQWISRQNSREESFLGRTNLQFSNTKKKLSISADYTLSEETRNARGLTYLEVAPGQGSFSYENGRYIPDPFGNYIQVEELLSEKSKVGRGEKSFQVSKNWEVMQIRFNSIIEEELLDSGRREVWWLLPFLSDDDQPYLVFNRNYSGEVNFLPIKGGHAINLAWDERREIRNLAGSPRSRHDQAGTLALKQVLNQYFIEERLKLFSTNRDSYYIGGGDIDGYQMGSSIRHTIASSEFMLGAGYRLAKSLIGEVSEIVTFNGECRIRVIEKGEWRNSLELYTQTLQNVTGAPSYQLTDNKSGTKGAIWSTGFNYSVRKAMRINFNLSGRHSNGSTAHLFGRTEVVAEF